MPNRIVASSLLLTPLAAGTAAAQAAHPPQGPWSGHRAPWPPARSGPSAAARRGGAGGMGSSGTGREATTAAARAPWLGAGTVVLGGDGIWSQRWVTYLGKVLAGGADAEVRLLPGTKGMF